MNLPLFLPGCVHHTPGWFILLWICIKWRNVLIGDASIWASCYSQYPKLQSVFLTRVGLVPLVYRLTASEPAVSPFTAMFYSDEVILANFFLYTPLDRCVEIHVGEGRGNDVTDYILELAAISQRHPLRYLQKLHLETWHWNWTGPRAEYVKLSTSREPR